MDILEIIKVIVLGVIEGVTEWLPVSSTGHMYLFDEFFPLQVNDAFKETFFVAIQLGAIVAVIVIFFDKLLPVQREKKRFCLQRNTLELWKKIIIACIPTAILGFLFDDFLETYLYNASVIAVMLIVYGIAFIVVERRNRNRISHINSVEQIDAKTAVLFGLFQSLAMIPGTSRSGATILGGLIIGVSREASAEFSFFLAIPTMFGATVFKIWKYFLGGNVLSNAEISVLVVGMGISFFVSLLVIEFLMNFVKKHNFKAFGWYRIFLGIILIAVFISQALIVG